jgi:carbonic anhydrase
MKFRSEDFARHRELFQQLSRSQDPHTLFIGCSDSRVVPNLITQTHPGELFIVRNVASIVPRCRWSGG